MTEAHDSNEQTGDSMSPSWIEQLIEGQEAAWNKLNRVYRKLILWWCLKSGIPPKDADDVTQDAFVAVRRGLVHYEHKSFRGWLWTITQRRIMDYWRNQNQQPVAHGGSGINEFLKEVEAESHRSVGPADRATKVLFDQIVEMVKSEFNEVHWQAFHRRLVDDKSAREVAEELGITRDVVHNATSRIRRRIREAFGELDDLG